MDVIGKISAHLPPERVVANSPSVRRSARSRRSRATLPVLGAALSLAPFLPLLVPDGRVIPSNDYCDYLSYQLPVREFARSEWLSGRVPLWIPWLGCGMPLHAGQQAALFYPLLTPLVLLFGANQGIRVSLFLHLLIAYAGEYSLARSLGIGRAASTFAAAVTALSAFYVVHLMEGHVTMVLAAALLPWVFLCLVRLARGPGPRAAAAIAIVFGLLVLTGHPQILYYASLFGTLWAVGSLAAGRAAAGRPRFLGWSIAAAVLAVSIGGVQLLPTAELLRDGVADSERGDAAYAGTYAAEPHDLLAFLVPFFKGNPLRGVPEFAPPGFFHEKVGYLGIVPLLLAGYALTRADARRWEYGAAALAVLSVLVALGNATPAFAAFGELVPGLFLFRCHARAYCMLSVLVPLLAGRGLDGLLRRRRAVAGRRWALTFAASWVLANGLVWLLASDPFPWDRYAAFYEEHAIEQWGRAAVLLASSAGVTAFAHRFRSIGFRPTYAAVFGVTLLDLWSSNAASFSLARETSPRVPAAVLAARPERFVDVPEPPGYTWGGLRYSKLVPTAIRDRLPTICTNEGGVVPAAVNRLQRAVERRGDPVLMAAACGYACVGEAREWRATGDAQPRVRFLAGASGSGVAIEEVRPEAPPTASDTVRTAYEDPQRLLVEIDAPEAGVLVVADTAYPGWVCDVDGRRSPIVPVHGVFRGGAVPAGRHRVEFRYEPRSFRWGLIGTIVGGAAACTVAAASPHRRKRQSRAAI